MSASRHAMHAHAQSQSQSQPQQRNRIALIGRMGAGKGSLGRALQSSLLIPWISVGDEIRRTLAKPSGQSLRDRLNGKDELLVGDADENILRDVAIAAVSSFTESGFIIDGYPRRSGEGRDAMSALALTHCIWIDTSIEICRSRIASRARKSDSPEKVYRRLHYEQGFRSLFLELSKLGVACTAIDGTPSKQAVHQMALKALNIKPRNIGD